MEEDKKDSKFRTEEEKKRLSVFHRLSERYIRGEELKENERKLLELGALNGNREEDERDVQEEKRTKHAILKKLRGKMSVYSIGQAWRWYAAAAVFLLAIGIGTVLRYALSGPVPVREVRIATADGMKTVKLPDGTVVHLNVGSALTYDANTFNVARRKVNLNGEAFFEVRKNPKKPFIIQSKEVQTMVLGTSFNVKAYDSLSESVVSVRSGRVRVSNGMKGVLAVLTHNQQLTWNNRRRTATLDSLDSHEAAGWQDGTVLFNNAGLDEIKLKAEHYYGLRLSTESLKECTVHLCGTYPSNDGGAALLRQLEDIYGIKNENIHNRIKLYR